MRNIILSDEAGKALGVSRAAGEKSQLDLKWNKENSMVKEIICIVVKISKELWVKSK
ncbi:predicted protein [Plenodomus lingam JN3]|uniref:Predicted protein n=1 Tax=Leptosphaeria maculans (strain JN3 / isolate v23.1.3 / race Av1-4-5-6-7-8) TaxID=985895 RepID=E4ZQA0_LEPMJ|nr:predicted protein [Plenodomus lingam JN3]CBX90010.1 predicted protein [Plenodomus lingam JN3]